MLFGKDGDLLRRFLGSFYVGAIVVNNKGEIIFLNNAATEIFGYTEEEALGKSVHGLIVPDRLQKACNQCFKTFESHGRRKVIGEPIRAQAKKKNGEEIWVELNLAEVENENWQWFVIGFVKKAAEEGVELKLLNQGVTNLKHDLRNYVTAVMGYAALLLAKTENPECRNFIEKINMATDKAAMLLDGMH